jgi:hypothetical protein
MESLSPRELVAAVCPKINDAGWAFYFVPATIARGEEIGLDVLSFYVLGRGGVLGDVDWQLVQSAFGYFKPSLIEATWEAARAKVSPREAAAAYIECCHAHGRLKLGDVEGLDGFNEAAAAVNDAAAIEGLTLYAGIKKFPLAEDAPARAMQLVTTLRELRGSAHLVANIANGVRPLEAHYGKRPEMLAMFGWDEAEAPELTDEVQARRKAAEATTDEIVLPAFSVLDEGQRQAMSAGMENIAEALARP